MSMKVSEYIAELQQRNPDEQIFCLIIDKQKIKEVAHDRQRLIDDEGIQKVLNQIGFSYDDEELSVYPIEELVSELEDKNWELFKERFEPIKNQIKPNKYIDGVVFLLSEEELEFIDEQEAKGMHIFTVGEGRFGYFVTPGRDFSKLSEGFCEHHQGSIVCHFICKKGEPDWKSIELNNIPRKKKQNSTKPEK